MGRDDPRGEPRTRAMIRARLRDNGSERETCILDISSRGVLATAARPPKRGEFVEIVVGANSLVGQVKWSSSRRFGLSLQDRVNVAALAANMAGAVIQERPSSVRYKVVPQQTSQGDWTDALRKVQFGLLVLAGIGAAYMLAGFAHEGLASLGAAKAAMVRP